MSKQILEAEPWLVYLSEKQAAGEILSNPNVRAWGMTEEMRPKKKILFVCVGNMCRSQMAEGFARSMGSEFAEVYSAGTNPTGILSEETVAVMQEKGIDISDQQSKGLGDLPVSDIDVIVSMANVSASELCPPFCSGVTVDWRVDDPIGRSIESYRATRDDIEKKVKSLLESIWKESPA